MSFADLGLSEELLSAVLAAGYDTPTPIQAQAIPSVLMMRDIIGIAQTGTGKTASFVLPMIDVLAHGRARARMPRSLILEPTRELADKRLCAVFLQNVVQRWRKALAFADFADHVRVPSNSARMVLSAPASLVMARRSSSASGELP